MHIQTHSFRSSSSQFSKCYFKNPTPKTLASVRTPPFNDVKILNAEWNKRKLCLGVNSKSHIKGKLNQGVSLLNKDLIMNVHSRKMKNQGAVFSAADGRNLSTEMRRKRKVVEHICLLKAKEELSDVEEKDMLDYLYTTQYQMSGIVAISLGRIAGRNLEDYTHAIYMRFQIREYLEKFYQNPFYLGVLKDHVMPYCHVCPDME